MALKMDMDYFLFLESMRSSNFKLYVASIGKFFPWIFAFDHACYARWLSIHHYDMEMLKERNPDVFQKFDVNGNFTVARTKNRFLTMRLDQRHKQLNKDVKGKLLNFTKPICLNELMNCYCAMVDRQKAFSLISSRDHCQRSSPSRISDTPQAGFEPAQNLSSGFVE